MSQSKSKKLEFLYDLCQVYQPNDFISPGCDDDKSSKVTQDKDGLTVLSTKNDQFMWFQAYRKPFDIHCEKKTCFVSKVASKQYHNNCTNSGILLVDPDNCQYYGFLMNEKEIRAVSGHLPDPLFQSEKKCEGFKYDKHYTAWKIGCDLAEYIKFKSYVDWCDHCVKFNKSVCDWSQWNKWRPCYLESCETSSFYTSFCSWKSDLNAEDYKSWCDWKDWCKKKRDHKSCERKGFDSESNCTMVMRRKACTWYQFAICFDPESREITWYIDGKRVHSLCRSRKDIAKRLGRRFCDKLFPSRLFFGMGNFAWDFGCTDCPCPEKLGSCIKVQYLKVLHLCVDESSESSSSSYMPSDSKSWVTLSSSSEEDFSDGSCSSSSSTSDDDCGSWSYSDGFSSSSDCRTSSSCDCSTTSSTSCSTSEKSDSTVTYESCSESSSTYRATSSSCDKSKCDKSSSYTTDSTIIDEASKSSSSYSQPSSSTEKSTWTKPKSPTIRFDCHKEALRSPCGIEIYRNGAFRPNKSGESVQC